MLAHVRERAPLEACGLLVGKNNLVEKVLLIENQAQSPVRFRMDPQDQLEAFNWIDSSGLDLIGIFHSHPAGPDTVSATDIEEAAYSVAQIVWSRKKGRWTARGFWIQNQQVTEVKLKVIEDEQP
ncbi:MAG TPA: M67 family metallopeptidase [Anaerolineales bacterium]|nr:M67 family metallopeptidase [Anaerolineales bacterium]